MEHYKIGITNDKLSFEISSHDKKWVEEQVKSHKDFIEVLLNTSTKKVSSVDSNGSGVSDDGSTKLSINEFYRKHMKSKITSRPEITTFFLYYLSKTTEKSEFTSTEVKELFKEVGYPNWNNVNIADALSQAKKRALLNNVGNQWSLSMTGEDFVLNKISNENG